jgi:NAD-dependent deacetylase
VKERAVCYEIRMAQVDDLVGRWRDAARVVVLTGAGLSTASGIPDFRSSGGRWERYQPVPLPDFMASREAREAYWRYKGETWQVIRDARPNLGHRALTQLALSGRIELLVTQNVDGLHLRCGFPTQALVHIHGTDAEVSCMRCGARDARKPVQARWEAGDAAPECACGGPLKPATISFGQSLVATDLERSMQAAASCDLLVAIGTSLVVGPINEMLPVASRAGASTAIVTGSETPFDDLADWTLSDPLEEILPRICAGVLGTA